MKCHASHEGKRIIEFERHSEREAWDLNGYLIGAENSCVVGCWHQDMLKELSPKKG